MQSLNFALAQRLLDHALADAATRRIGPLAVAVLDARGSVRALAAQDGLGIRHPEVAIAKANSCLALGENSGDLAKAAIAAPHFFVGAAHVVHGLIPLAGGVLIQTDEATIVGAIGVTGSAPDEDQAVAIAAIEAVGLVGRAARRD